uniref:Uncharacterized protein n=1 Tax=Panagrolaimus davidi TaxID=227884 RepID=A0A914QPI3_9BILA
MNVTSAAGSIPIATADVIKELLLSNKTPVSKEELMAKAVENVLVELMEDIMDESMDKIKENVDDHLNNLASANTYKIPSEFGKMLYRTSKKLIEGLESVKKNDSESVKKFEKAKADVLLNLKAYEKANEIGNHKASSEKNSEPLKNPSEELITLMQTRLENLKISRDTVSAEQKLQEELRKERTKADADLVEIVGNLERLKIEEVDLKEVLKYLQQGIEQLSRVQVAWSNIIVFFDNIQNSVEGPLVQHIYGYTTRVKNSLATPEKAVTERQRSILFREVTKACAVANVLMQSAAFYKTLSTQHIRPVIDDTVMKIGMSQDAAMTQKQNISTNFKEIKDAVKNSVEAHNHYLSSKVFGAMKKQGFDVSQAIESNRCYKSLSNF